MGLPMTEQSAENQDLAQNDEVVKKIEGVLKPLTEKKEFSFEYRRLFKEMMDMDRRFRLVEETFADAFAKIVDLEKKICT